MSWISLVLQMMALRRGITESRSMLDRAREYAEVGKRTAAAALAGLVAALFFFVGVVLAVIELGLQIDAGLGIRYSGLMVSATILLGIGLVNVGLATWLGRRPMAPPPLPPSSDRGERVKDLLEDFLSSFLHQFLKPKHEKVD